jgi:Sap, sulfolipid-1-addressing protein
VTAEFFVLALAAAVNPSLLAVDLGLVVNQRPRAMFVAVLLGGLAMAVAVGLVYVLVLRFSLGIDASGLGGGAHLALGIVLLALAWALFTRRLPRRRQRKPDADPKPGADPGADPEPSTGPEGSGDPEPSASPAPSARTGTSAVVAASPATRAGAKPEEQATTQEKNGRIQRILRQPRPGLGFLMGLLLGTPGAIYLAALHGLVHSHSSTSVEVLAVILFAIIEFALLIIPLIFLITRPHAAAAFIRGMQDWLLRHGRLLLGYVALIAGIYLTIDAIVSLL